MSTSLLINDQWITEFGIWSSTVRQWWLDKVHKTCSSMAWKIFLIAHGNTLSKWKYITPHGLYLFHPSHFLPKLSLTIWCIYPEASQSVSSPDSNTVHLTNRTVWLIQCSVSDKTQWSWLTIMLWSWPWLSIRYACMNNGVSPAPWSLGNYVTMKLATAVEEKTSIHYRCWYSHAKDQIQEGDWLPHTVITSQTCTHVAFSYHWSGEKGDMPGRA